MTTVELNNLSDLFTDSVPTMIEVTTSTDGTTTTTTYKLLVDLTVTSTLAFEV